MIYRVSKVEHNRLVAHAKEMLKLHLHYKWEVCKVAVKVCHLPDKKGGRIPKGAYSITDLADDIKINRKTLSCWILDFEIYQKLNIDDSKFTLTQQKKFNGTITRTRKTLFNMNEVTRGHVKAAKKEDVVGTFNKLMRKDPLLLRLEDFERNLKHHLYTFTNEEFNATHLDQLIAYRKVLREVHDALGNVLRKKLV
jgi:hypothetical protein